MFRLCTVLEKGVPRTICRQLCHFSSRHKLSQLPLAFDLHEPRKDNNSLPVGIPIIFIHGLFGSKRNNRSISKILARDLNRPVYALDLRNHGDSPHNVQHDYASLAEDIEGFINEHKLHEAVLIGHSMGAKAAMTVALHQPSLVNKLVSVDNAPIDAALKSDFGKYLQGMKKIEDAKVTKQSDADRILQEYEESLTIRQFLLTNLVRSDQSASSVMRFRIPLKTLARALDHMADFPYKDPEEVRFKKPALFIRGIRSHYVSDESFPLIGQFFPLFEVRDIDSGHWVISENPQAFRDAVCEFLKDKT